MTWTFRQNSFFSSSSSTSSSASSIVKINSGWNPIAKTISMSLFFSFLFFIIYSITKPGIVPTYITIHRRVKRCTKFFYAHSGESFSSFTVSRTNSHSKHLGGKCGGKKTTTNKNCRENAHIWIRQHSKRNWMHTRVGTLRQSIKKEKKKKNKSH